MHFSSTQDIAIGPYFNGTLIDLDIYGEAMVRIRLKNAIGYSEPSDFVKYMAPRKKYKAKFALLCSCLIESFLFLSAKQDAEVPLSIILVSILVPLAVVLIVVVFCVVLYKKRNKTTRI
jgi:hypothetical protein